MNHAIRTGIAFILLLAIGWAVWVGARGKFTSSGGVAGVGATPGAKPRTERTGASLRSSPGQPVETSVSDTSPPDPRTPPADDELAETSWTDPFAEDYWLPLPAASAEPGPGWTFDDGAMAAAAGVSSGAMFRRTYREFSLDVTLKRTGPAGALEIRLSAADSETILGAAFSDAAVEVSAAGTRDPRSVLRRSHLNPPLSAEEPARLRLAATGNRIIIWHHGRRILNCDQPPELVNQPLAISLFNGGSACRITGLRLDGK